MARSFTAASSQYISVPSAAPINLGSGSFAISFWARFPVAPPSNSAMIHKRTGGFDGGQGWEFAVTNGVTGAVRWDVQNGAVQGRATATLGTLSNGAWHHFLLTHIDGTPDSIAIYYDGTLAGSTTASLTGTVDTATPMTIGAAYNAPTSAFINGEFAELALFDRAVTANERAQLLARFAPVTLRALASAWFPLVGGASVEIDPIGGTIGTLVNAPPSVAHPAIIYDEPPQSGPDTWYESISATIAGQSAVSASLSADIPLSATVDGQSTFAANLTAEAGASAAISGQSSVAAAATLDKHIRSEIEGQSAVDANANYEAAASATVAGQSVVTANLTGDAYISATIAGQSAVTASATRGRTIQAQVDGQSTVTAATIADHGMAATIDGQGALTASLAADTPVAATVTGQSALTANLTADASVSATIAGQSATAATIVRSRAGSAAITGQSAMTASATVDAAMAAFIAAQSSVTADASVDAGASALIEGQSSVNATLRKLGEKITLLPGAELRWRFTTGGRFL